jgi:hypothetical protein
MTGAHLGGCHLPASVDELTTVLEAIITVCNLPGADFAPQASNLIIGAPECTRIPDAFTCDNVFKSGAVSRDFLAWHAIDWRLVHQNVRRLQARIVKAVPEGR